MLWVRTGLVGGALVLVLVLLVLVSLAVRSRSLERCERVEGRAEWTSAPEGSSALAGKDKLGRAKVVSSLHWPGEAVDAAPLTSITDIHRAWFQVVSSSTADVWFSTYVWHYHHRTLDDGSRVLNPHLHLLGLALRHLYAESARHGRHVTVRILVNRAAWLMPKRQVEDAARRTLEYWRSMRALEPPPSSPGSTPFLRVEFRVWEHRGLNNVHGKLVLGSDREVVATSINVEHESYGGPGSWHESGCWVRCHQSHRRAVEFLREHWNQARPVASSSSPASGRNNGSSAEFGHPLDLSRLVDRQGEHVGLRRLTQPFRFELCQHVRLLCDRSSANPWATDLERSSVLRAVLDVIEASTREVVLLSPTFNLEPVWQALLRQKKRHPDLRARVMLGWEFNVSHPLTQRHLLAYRLNRDFARARAGVHRDLEWRWFADGQGRRATRHSGAMCHAKAVVGDARWVVTGSFNLDVWSALHSMETAVVLEGPALAQRLLDELFEPLWATGVRVTKQNC